ncbi:MAG: polysaccharide pyruvyl transferase family protein [Thermoanaerobaculaceae bacterium]|nr:polysaccharide pyruvyl transferase family protein [Thermoanaerobaculaceae bacterium]
MRVVLLNTHSVLNSGDAAIVVAEIELLRELLGDVQITATSRTPQQDAAFFRELRATVLPPLLPAPSVWRTVGEQLAGCMGNLAALHMKRRLVHAIARADLVISSGGGYFFSNRKLLPGPMFWQAYGHVFVAQRLGKRVLFAPQSFGPFADPLSVKLVRRLLQHPRVVAVLVREASSLELLRALPANAALGKRIALCPDLAFVFPSPVPSSVRPDGARGRAPVLGVTVREWSFPECSAAERDRKRAAYLHAVTEACLAFHRSQQGSICILPQARGPGRFEDDRAMARELHHRLVSAIPAAHVTLAELAPDLPPQGVLRLVAGTDLLLATRLHSAIFACLAGRPFLAIGYQPKTAGIMSMLGLEDCSIPMGAVTAERLTATLQRLVLEGPSLVERRIRPATARLAAQARATMTAVLLPLAAGR